MLGLLLLLACGSAVTGPGDAPVVVHQAAGAVGYYLVCGVVLDGVTGEPIEGALVEWTCGWHGWTGRAFTDWAGHYYCDDKVCHADCHLMGIAGKDGYLGQGMAINGAGPSPLVHHFILLPDPAAPGRTAER